MKIMVVSAHPDDMEVGCAGLMLNLAGEGHEIISVIATSARRTTDENWITQQKIRENESKNAHTRLKVTPIFLGCPTGRLLYLNVLFQKMLEEIFSKVKPDAVFTLSPIDVHPDHCALHPTIREFCLAKGVNTEYFLFEVCAGTTAPYPQTMRFIPTHYVDISKVINLKKEMIRKHQSQNPEGLCQSNFKLWQKRGKDCSVPLAEGFLRLTREGPIRPELAKWMIPSPHLPLIESLYGGEYICAKA